MARPRSAASNLSVGESAEFQRLLSEFGLQPERFAVLEPTLVPDFGVSVTLVTVTGAVETTYSRAEGDWLLHLERDLRAGLFEEGRELPP